MAYVQASYTASSTTSSVSSLSTTFPAATAAGNCLVAILTWEAADTAFSSFTDNLGNTWSQVGKTLYDSVSTQSSAVFITFNSVAGSPTLSLSLGSSVPYVGIVAVEFSNVACLDTWTSQAGECDTSTDNMTSGNIITTANGESIVGLFVNTQNSNNYTAGTGFTGANVTTTAPVLGIEYATQTTAGTIAATGTMGGSGRARYAGFVLALRPKAVLGTATAAYVQSPAPTYTQSTSVSSTTNTFDSANTSGNCLIAFVTWYTGSSDNVTLSSFADNQGNTWTQLMNITNATDHQAAALYVCTNCAGGAAATVTLTLSSSTPQVAIVMGEYTGIDSVDVYNSSNTSHTTAANNLTTGSITTTAANECIVGFFVGTTNEGTITTSSPFTQRELTPNTLYPVVTLIDGQQATAGSTTITATCAQSGRHIGMIVAFKNGTTSSPVTVNGRVSGFIDAKSTDYTEPGATKSVILTTQPGDFLVVYGGGEHSGMNLNTPSGNSVSFTSQQSVAITNTSTAYLWTGIDTIGGTNWTLSCSCPTNVGNFWGFTCVIFRGINGFGASASGYADTTTQTTPLLPITTTADNSYIVVFMTDYYAFATAGRTWQTVNSITPSAANSLELNVDRDSTSYGEYGGYYPTTGTAGSKTVGLTYPTPIAYAMVAQELLVNSISVASAWLYQ